MRIPPLFKTIRFRLTLWYSGILVILLLALLFAINLAMAGRQPPVTGNFPGSDPRLEERQRSLSDLRTYSYIGVGAILVLGSVAGYIISGMMLEPVDRVSSLAARISHTNLKERINHQGPQDEMKRLADTFDDMLERLDNAFESQKQFIQDASHELKTPIATAQTNIEVLEMDRDATVDDYKHMTEVVKRSLDRLSFLSQGLLLLSQGSQTQSKWSEVDLTLLVGEVVAESQPMAAAAEVSLESTGSTQALRVKGDAIGLKQVISNLVDNGIKYNRQGGRVDISTRAEGSMAVLEVRDSGVGIAATDQQRVFDRFYRVDKSRSRAQGGSGLGLAIVKKIVEEHGGAVSVQSTVGTGSAFRISLPLIPRS